MSAPPFSAIEVWTAVAVASRTVEVNTKTGFSLTAGSYVVLASSMQIATIAVANGTTSNTATITSVTTTRATVSLNGYTTPVGDTLHDSWNNRTTLTNGTTVTSLRSQNLNLLTTAFTVWELF